MADMTDGDKAEEVSRQQASAFTSNSQKPQSTLYSEKGKQRLDIKKIKMESKQFIQSAGNQAIQNMGMAKPDKRIVSSENTETGLGSPLKESKNVLLEPIQMNEASLTPLKT